MNMTTRIEEIVAEKINNHRYTVDQKLIDRLDEEFQKPAYRYRANVDALAMEITMRWAGKLKTKDKLPDEQYQWRHDDWIVHAHRDYLIDYKRKPFDSNNCSISNKEQMVESYNMGELTHLVAFSTNFDRITEEIIGKELRFRFLKMKPIKEAWKESFKPEPEYRLWPVN